MICHLVMDLDGKCELRVSDFDNRALRATASVACWGREAVTIYQLFVTEKSRVQGVGRSMVEYIIKQAFSNGSEAVSAIVEDGGPIGFWKALGFKTAHAEDGKVLVSRRITASESQ